MKGFLGVSVDFDSDIVFEPTITTRNLYVDKIINILSTRKGERVMRPDFGSVLWQYLFENISDEDLLDLQDVVRKDLLSQLPFLSIELLKLSGATTGILNCYIRFKAPDDSEAVTIDIDLVNGF